MAHYHTPNPDALTDAPRVECNMLGGSNTADFFTSIGIPCTLAHETDAPQLVKYHLNLLDISQYNENRIKKAIAAYGAHYGYISTFERSNYADFAVCVAKPDRQPLYLKDLMNAPVFGDYTCVLGIDTDGEYISFNMADAPHILIAGTTGSGKSVLLNTLLCSNMFCSVPLSTHLCLIDVKRVELAPYKKSPYTSHFALDSNAAVYWLKYYVTEMENRYKKMESLRIRSLSDRPNLYPRIFIVIDELADLMLQRRKEVEPLIVRIAQLGRAAGIHLIVATQRPSTDVITGLIKANIPTKIALHTANAHDSMTILGHGGAEKLTGKGDAIIKTADSVIERRFQTAYTPDADIEYIIETCDNEYWPLKARFKKLKKSILETLSRP